MEQRTMADLSKGPRAPLLMLTAIVMALMGVMLLAGGIWLAALGGSPYYAIAAIALMISAWLLATRRAEALWLYAALLLGTMIWSIWEVRSEERRVGKE